MDDPAETQIFTRTPGDRAPFLPGTVVGGRYRIVALAGRGGMGEVWSPRWRPSWRRIF